MPAIKHSKQREAIKDFLKSRYDHPTADTVYVNIRQQFPNISLGTVYRNLSLLSELGEIKKITAVDGPDRFDGNLEPHYHFICSKCGSITDLNIDRLDIFPTISGEEFKGNIEGHVTYFYGTCADCLNQEESGNN